MVKYRIADVEDPETIEVLATVADVVHSVYRARYRICVDVESDEALDELRSQLNFFWRDVENALGSIDKVRNLEVSIVDSGCKHEYCWIDVVAREPKPQIDSLILLIVEVFMSGGCLDYMIYHCKILLEEPVEAGKIIRREKLIFPVAQCRAGRYGEGEISI